MFHARLMVHEHAKICCALGCFLFGLDVVFVRCVHSIICNVTATTMAMAARVRYGQLVGRSANYPRACERLDLTVDLMVYLPRGLTGYVEIHILCRYRNQLCSSF